MKHCAGILVSLLAGYLAAGASAGPSSRQTVSFANVAREEIAASANEYRESIHGTVDEIIEFVDGLTLSHLKDIIGKDYGKPFRITFLENDSGKYEGYIAGYFTTDGGVSFDSDSSIPGGGSLPTIKKQPSLAPKVTTITLSGGQSSKIIDAGKVSNSDLEDLLGEDYGKPFKLILTSSSGSNVGFVSGSFDSDGPKFDSGIKIPSPKPIKITLSGSQSSKIINAGGKVSSSDLRDILGDDYGKAFKLILTDSGDNVGYLSGSFSSGGTAKFDSDSKIPSPKTTQITLSGSQSSKIINAGRVSTSDLRDILGKNYGAPFKLTLTNPLGDHIGFVSGSFDGGDVEFDDDIDIPSSKPTEITLSGSQSSKIIDAGEVSSSDLKNILGKDYGRSFKLTLTNSSGDHIGFISGSFDGGDVEFDDDIDIPSSKPTEITLSSSQSSKIIDAGEISSSDLRDILGKDYGRSFKLTLTNSSGDHIGFISGSFDGGDVEFDDDIKIPSPKPTTTKTSSTSKPTTKTSTSVQPPKPTDAPSGSNTGSVSISGQSTSEIGSFLNNLDRDYILKAVGGHYGSFYITFTNSDGSLQGYIKGTISKDSFSYNWSYSYKG